MVMSQQSLRKAKGSSDVRLRDCLSMAGNLASYYARRNQLSRAAMSPRKRNVFLRN